MKKCNKKILMLSILLVFLIMGAASAASDDVNTTLSDDSNSQNIMTQDNSVEKTDTVSTDTVGDNKQSEILSDDDDSDTGNFTELNNLIQENKGYGKVIDLDKNYTYNNDGGTIFLGTFTEIDGHGFVINANNNAHIFETVGTDIVLRNIIFKNT